MTNEELPQEDQTRVRKAKFLQWVGIVILGFAVIIIGLIYYWSLVPTQAIELRDKITVRPSEGIKQQPFFVNINFCSKVKAQGSVEVRLVGPYSEIISSNSDIKLEKQCGQITSPLLIPPGAAPGKYKIKYIVKVKANPIRVIEQEVQSESFTVKE